MHTPWNYSLIPQEPLAPSIPRRIRSPNIIAPTVSRRYVASGYPSHTAHFFPFQPVNVCKDFGYSGIEIGRYRTTDVDSLEKRLREENVLHDRYIVLRRDLTDSLRD